MLSCGFCLSVCVSVTFMYSVKMAKRIVKLSHHLVDPPFLFFHTKLYGSIWMGNPSRAKIVIFDQYLFLESMTCDFYG